MFISFDGIDGSGKSTQLALFVEWLRHLGRDVVTCRDPGSTPLGEDVREILLHAEYRIDHRAEMMLYMAARAQLVKDVIRPALAAGKVVVSDRYVMATAAYQGAAGGIAADDVWRVGEIATDYTFPDLTFILDLDPAQAAQRMTRERDRMESKGLEYFSKVREGFLQQAKRLPDRVTIVNAMADVNVIQAQIQTAASAKLRIQARP